MTQMNKKPRSHSAENYKVGQKWMSAPPTKNDLQKQLYIKHKVTENSVMTGTAVDRAEGTPDTNGEPAYIDLNNDYMSDFVRGYEKKMEDKKKAQTKSKKGLEKFIDGDDEKVEKEKE